MEGPSWLSQGQRPLAAHRAQERQALPWFWVHSSHDLRASCSWVEAGSSEPGQHREGRRELGAAHTGRVQGSLLDGREPRGISNVTRGYTAMGISPMCLALPGEVRA